MKYATIEDLLFSTKNIVAAEKETGQFNDLFKMLLNAHGDHNALLGDKARDKDDE